MHRKMIKLVDSHPCTFNYRNCHRWNRRGVPPSGGHRFWLATYA
jgi:hypothetical protein